MENQDFDELFEEAAKLVIGEGAGSASLLQRRLEVGYARAARMLDQLVEAGVLAPSEGNRPRKVIVNSFGEVKKKKLVKKTVKIVENGHEVNNVEWRPMSLTESPFMEFQKENYGKEEILFPLGLNIKGKVIYQSIKDVGHVYIFNSQLSKANELVKNCVEVIVNLYQPEALKLIVTDDVGMISFFREPPHLLTDIVTETKKIENALFWAVAEKERRFKIFKEVNTGNIEQYNKSKAFTHMPRVLCVINNAAGDIANNENVVACIERLSTSGHLAGIHLIVCSPLGDKKYSKTVTSFPTKLIFKTFSTTQADLLGTDDAFDLQSPNDFLLVPAYGKVEKLSVK